MGREPMPRDVDAPREPHPLMLEAARIRAAAALIATQGLVPVARLLPQQGDSAGNIPQHRIKSILGGRERMMHESEIRLRQLG